MRESASAALGSISHTLQVSGIPRRLIAARTQPFGCPYRYHRTGPVEISSTVVDKFSTDPVASVMVFSGLQASKRFCSSPSVLTKLFCLRHGEFMVRDSS